MAMHGVISDPSMHEFTGGTPLGLGELTKRYQVLARRRSPDGTEIWCNWALREMSSGELVGTVQATLPAGGPGLDVAKVAWEVGPDFQGRGLASEAAAALVERLLGEQLLVVAHIHPRHFASQRVATHAKLVPTSTIVGEEVRWWADPWGGREMTECAFDPWQPRDVAARLGEIDVPWCVVAGWALDLFLGGQPREHEDLEIAVPIGEFDAVRLALPEYQFDVVAAGHAWSIDSPAAGVLAQTWVRDPLSGSIVMDVFREPHDRGVWICRRDRSIRCAYADIIAVTSHGVPYLAPEVVLLFKAKHSRAKDDADFDRVLPALDARRRAWLLDALDRVHPGHRWLPVLLET